MGWLLIAAIVTLSLLPVPVELPRAAGGDKTGHVLAYAAAMFWFAQIYTRRRPRLRLALALLLLGCGLEVFQSHVGRTFEYADMMADATGIVAAWLLACPRTPNLLERLAG